MSNGKTEPRIELESTRPDHTAGTASATIAEWDHWVEQVVAEFARLTEDDFLGYEDGRGLVFRPELAGVRSNLATLEKVVAAAREEQDRRARKAVEALLIEAGEVLAGKEVGA